VIVAEVLKRFPWLGRASRIVAARRCSFSRNFSGKNGGACVQVK
jgi:hypothetical protein